MKTINEPVLEYAPNSNERINIQKEYDRMASTITEIPLIIDGKEIFTHEISECIQPHDHQKVLAKYHKAQEKEVNIAISSSLKSWVEWSQTSVEERCKIFRNAADLLRGPWRDRINAATMLNQSKNIYQA